MDELLDEMKERREIRQTVMHGIIKQVEERNGKFFNRKRRDLFDAQDAIDSQRDELIGRIEKHLQQRHSSKPLFMFRWSLDILEAIGRIRFYVGS